MYTRLFTPPVTPCAAALDLEEKERQLEIENKDFEDLATKY